MWHLIACSLYVYISVLITQLSHTVSCSNWRDQTFHAFGFCIECIHRIIPIGEGTNLVKSFQTQTVFQPRHLFLNCSPIFSRFLVVSLVQIFIEQHGTLCQSTLSMQTQTKEKTQIQCIKCIRCRASKPETSIISETIRHNVCDGIYRSRYC